MLNSSFKKPFHLRLIFTMDKNSSDGVPLPQRYGAILTIVLGLTMAVLDYRQRSQRLTGGFNLDR